MADYNLITFDTTNERKKREDSAGITIDFTAVRIGTSELVISETTGAFSFGNNVISNVSTPILGTDVANKNYVDGVAQGLDVKLSIRALSTQAVSNDSTTPVYNPEGGASTQGQLTFTTGPTAIDGVTLANTNRVLLKNEVGADTFTITTPGGSALGVSTVTTLKQSLGDFTTSGTGTGLIIDVTTDATPDITLVTVVSAGIGYAVTDTVTISTAVIETATITVDKSPANCIWVRTSANTWDLAIDFDEDTEVTAGAFTFVEEGTINSDTGYVLSSNDPITVGTTSIVWTQFSSAGVLSAGDGIDIISNVISVDLAANGAGTGGLQITGTELEVDAGDGIVLDADGVNIDLLAASGLQLSATDGTGQLSVDLAAAGVGTGGLTLVGNEIAVDPGDGIELTAGGVAVNLAANGAGTGGLQITTGEVEVDAGDGIRLDADGVNIDLLAASGLELSATDGTGQLSVDLAAAGIGTGGLTLVGNEIAVDPGVGIQLTAGGVAIDSSEPFTNDNGGTITVRQVVYIKANGNVDLARNDVTNLDDFELGLVEDATILTTASGEITVRRGAIVPGFTGLTPGKKQYVSDATAGALTETLSGFVAGEHVYSVGRAISATEVLYDPHYEFEF